MEQLLAEPAVGVGQLEGPQEVVGRLEVGADRVDLVDKVLHADDAGLAEGALDHRVVRDRDALLMHLRIVRGEGGREGGETKRFLRNTCQQVANTHADQM